jgi:hypothetical protein
MAKNRFVMNDHNVICDRSGQKYKRSECRMTWNGFLVHKSKWEPRQPQDFVSGKDDQQHVEDARPRGEVKFYVPTADEL